MLVEKVVNAAAYIKFDGIDGESKDSRHEDWIDVLSVDWGAAVTNTNKPRRRGTVAVRDFTVAVLYDKASPALQDACLKGRVIPKLELEETTTGNEANTVYLKYELTNVQITSFSIGSGIDTSTSVRAGDVFVPGLSLGGKPVMVVTNNFEEIKVTYTQLDEDHSAMSEHEYEYNVRKGV